MCFNDIDLVSKIFKERKAETYSRPGFHFRRICLRVNYLITFRALRSMVRATKIRKITPLINCCVADS